ncbi:MAG: leucine-rich repeat domain-containing protein [Bacteroides sp.]|nr:leucine-rich repeat domain-containing protein [Bacillota bacterium]MCM1455205.1 leucine-rich repeat domain-containing protein [Bacteroides sp.]
MQRKNLFLVCLLLLVISIAIVGCDNNDGAHQPSIECSHSYDSQVVQPSCVQRGYTIYTCSKCNKSYEDNYVDCLGHNYIERAQNYKCSICDKYEDGGFTFSLVYQSNNEYQVDSVSSSAIENGVIEIPRKHLGLKVTKLNRGCLYNIRKSLVALKIKSNINYIGSSLFTYGGQFDNVKTALKLVIFDNDCKDINISHTAFNSCNYLEEVLYPDECFSCFNHDDLIGNHYLFENTKFFNNNVVKENGLYYIRDLLLSSDKSTVASNVVVKDGTRLIANQVFKQNTNITSVYIPVSVIYIGKSAFSQCMNLHDIYYQGDETQFSNIMIEDNTFEDCGALSYQFNK